MTSKPSFHGSDLEQIEHFYHIPKEEIICFGANINPLGFPESVMQAVSEHLSDFICHYPDREYVALREAIGNYCAVQPEYIVVGNGSTELISLLIRSRNIRHAMEIGPSYSEYERELNLNGCAYSSYYLDPAQSFHPDVSEIVSAAKEQHIDFLILCNPNNPTASSFSSDELRTLLSACKEEEIFVMIDETYAEFSARPFLAMPLVSSFDNLMVIRGVSKFFAAPGLRLGYGACSDKNYLAYLSKVQNPWSVNSIAAFAGSLLFSDTDYIQKTKALISSERTRMIQGLSDLPGLHVYPSDTNFILVQIKDPAVTSFSLFEYLIQKKLMIRDCSSFTGLKGNFFRFCLLHPEENELLLNEIRNFFTLQS